MVRNEQERRAHCSALRFDHGSRFGPVYGADQRYAGLRDSGFVRGDQLDGVAQNLRVIEPDVGDEAHQRMQNVGAVEFAADADFNHSCIDALLRKIQERQREQRFIVRGPRELARNAIHRRDQRIHQIRKPFLGNWNAVDFGPFGYRTEMRLGMQSRAFAGSG